MRSVRSARLDGPAHERIGSIAAIAEERAAITLSRGGASKTYGYIDPNEDSVGFAHGAGGSLAVVADGHHGARGSVRALDVLLDEYAPAWTDASTPFPSCEAWEDAARAMLQRVHESLIEQGRELHIAAAPTTLSVALVRPDEDLLLHASVGDSHVFAIADAGRAVDVAWATVGSRRTFFLGETYESALLDRGQSVVGSAPIADLEAVVLATDGLSEERIGVEDPAAAVDDAASSARPAAAELRALECARALTERAVAAHVENTSGDNIGVAVLWMR